ncbi:MAG: S46 family peptidase, partial [Alistipes sp.]|nr:S46 family peptidase [Alistipes sp.]
MKRIVLTLMAAAVAFAAQADEGMWLLPYLQKMNIKDMKQKGCKLSAEDIYSVDKASLKDAVVIFGNGCTGEVVSKQGLLLTNHHCGFGAIQQLSSVEHDYLKNGFWSQSFE